MAKLILNVAKEITYSRGDMKKFAEKKGGLCFATEYINKQNPLEWQYKEGRKHAILSQKIIPVQRHIISEHIKSKDYSGTRIYYIMYPNLKI
ncbi:hypothetical protein GLOIN_2v1778083 [Rhizophagus irregularis DAOM 181602=DAOM 197198]|uniref:Uncharacterized protein n=1 Tax=Rhizophagus irregularis (strain DAOM 181602 / DAOM 197198 / MUCL 43194) TaxID=747089 RepID=A0A2P4PT82_RHIID|nr:hypothetical protein GLOIN_2v1778083 [Rhizophagus irregularis DAOM 181602=DAOM 197198]POG68579.1 hypothetical protein GLOIN_2v1778083 [Rhizophagus irregularis DAOM 181602=DAOM 197198]GET60024.1 hypothetical protein GLOIN_2v1778083 [Rhizophagus irregularis DAOM 181602=DAOM 197198]|eukprot:XP_025175445.1 hypothetical protein GLOIN_2v1778083 [Rhizophagus irregularis DAOM 181602=DAOM 197198]